MSDNKSIKAFPIIYIVLDIIKLIPIFKIFQAFNLDFFFTIKLRNSVK